MTVLLDGQGADELFGGYILTQGFALRSLGPRAMARASRRPATRLPVRLALGARPMPRAVAHAASRAPPRLAVRDGGGRRAARRRDRTRRRPTGRRRRDPLRDQLLRQAFSYSLPQPAALRRPQLDGPQPRGAAAVPRPARRRVRAVAAARLPARRRHHEAGAARRGARPRPAEVLARRDKVGFEPPQAQWLGSETGRAWAAEVLLDPAARGERDRRRRRRSRRTCGRGRGGTPTRCGGRMNVELWRDAFDPARRNSAVGAAS